MAQTDVTRETIARDLMKADPNMDLAVALAEADMMIEQGVATPITSEREVNPWDSEVDTEVEVMPWDEAGEADTGPEVMPWDEEKVEPKSDWTPLPTDVVTGKKTDWTPMGESHATNMESLYQPATSDVKYSKPSEGYYPSGNVDKTSPYWEGKDDYGIASQMAGEDFLGFLKDPWKGQERLGEEGVAALPEEKPSEYNKVSQIEDPMVRAETEAAIDERLYTPFLDKALDAMEADPKAYEGQSMAEVAREMAMDDRIADAAEMITITATAGVGGAAFTGAMALLTKYTGKKVAQSIISKAIAAGGIGAVENVLGGIAGNLAGGRDWDEGLDIDAMVGAGAGVAAPLVVDAVTAVAKPVMRGVGSAVEWAGNKIPTIEGAPGWINKVLEMPSELGRSIKIPSKQSYKAASVSPQASEIEAIKDAQQASTFRKMGEDTARQEDIATREYFEAQVRNQKEIDILIADKDAMMASAVTPGEQQAIATTYDKMITRAEKKMDNELESITSASGKKVEDMEKAAIAESGAIYDNLMNQKLFDDITVGDFVQMRDKMAGAAELVEVGGKVGVGSVGKQFDKGRATNEFLMSARSPREKLSGAVLGEEPGKVRSFVADALGLREGDVIKSRVKGEKTILDNTSKALKDSAKATKEEYPQKSVSDAYEYLQQRIKATKAGDFDKVKEAQVKFDKNISNLNIEGVDPMLRNELVDTSRKLKFHSKVVKDSKGKADIPENPLASVAIPLLSGAVDLASGGGLSAMSAIKGASKAAGFWAAKKLSGKWTTTSARGRFNELNKAFNGTLEYNKELADLLESGLTPAKVATYLILSGEIGEDALRVVQEEVM